MLNEKTLNKQYFVFEKVLCLSSFEEWGQVLCFIYFDMIFNRTEMLDKSNIFLLHQIWTIDVFGNWETQKGFVVDC